MRDILFNKTITLKEHERDKLVHFYKLRGGYLKVGSSINVPDNFTVIVAHYDKICDVLTPGNYHFDRKDMPILTKANKAKKTRNGEKTPKKIKADVYFVYEGLYQGIKFKTPKFNAIYKGKKRRIKLKGECSVQIRNSLKTLSILLDDYAVIDDKKTQVEIASHVGVSVGDVLNANLMTIEGFVNNDKKIIELVNEYTNKPISQLGIEVSNVDITEVLLPRKLQKELAFDKDNVRRNGELQDFIDNNVKKEDTINSEPVLARGESYVAAEQESSQSNEPDIDVEQALSSVGKEQFNNNYQKYLDELNTYNKSKENIPVNVGDGYQAPPSIIEDKEPSGFIILPQAQPASESQQESYSPPAAPTEQVASDKLFCSYCGAELPKGAKFCYSCGKSTSKFKTCPCCGAKNFADATICCVCKSNLD